MLRSRSAVSTALLGVMAIVYMLQLITAWRERREIYGSRKSVLIAVAEAPRQFLAGAAIRPGLLSEGEWWRLLTAIFLHAGLLHLLYNAWALLQFGSLLETVCGSTAMLLTFFVSGILASTASSLFLDAEYGVGASGAIFGIVGALIALLSRIQARRAKIKRLLQLQLVLWAALTIAGGFLSPSIDNTAHIAGCGAGFGVGMLLRQRNERGSRSSESSSASARLTGMK